MSVFFLCRNQYSVQLKLFNMKICVLHHPLRMQHPLDVAASLQVVQQHQLWLVALPVSFSDRDKSC